MKSDIFNEELSKINDDDVRKSTIFLLNNLPDYFYEIPASSSGKYHPSFSLGDGGLVRHVKVACKVGEELFRNECFSREFDNYKRDLIRMAIILHDGFKSGLENTSHTVSEHPLLMANFIVENAHNLSISPYDAANVARLISSHMGPWTQDKQGNEILPRPIKNDELFVHLCDYIASRNFLNVSFENNEIVDSAQRTLNKN